jgi:acetyl-CoA carboxylase biotin carboxyl carrier protein
MFELTEQDVFRLVEMFGASDAAFMHVKVGDVEVILSRSDADGPPSTDRGTGVSPAATGAVAGQADRGSVASDGGGAAPVTASVSSPTTTSSAVTPPEADVATDLVTVSAPTLGTFYSASRPDLPPYVQVGSAVEPETTVGLVEAMKVFTGVSADVYGTVVECLVENGDFVEYGQPLFRVKPQAPDGGSAR